MKNKFYNLKFETIKNATKVLIEKEWCYFGHRFRQSLQHYNYSFKYNDSVFYSSNGTNINAHTVSIKPDDDLNSDNLENDNEDSAEPIFIIFLDCCFQIMNQFPNMFQFNTNLLLFYAKHAYSCRFGNFLTNCESERVQYGIVKNFESIQTAIQKNTNYFISLNYTPEMSGKFIIPLVEDEDFRLWKQYYLSLFNSHKIYNSKFVKVWFSLLFIYWMNFFLLNLLSHVRKKSALWLLTRNIIFLKKWKWKLFFFFQL